jgi:hypothetical protein
MVRRPPYREGAKPKVTVKTTLRAGNMVKMSPGAGVGFAPRSQGSIEVDVKSVSDMDVGLRLDALGV